MDIFEIIEYLFFGAMGSLFIWALYTLIKYFREILFAVYKYLKYEILSSAFLLPIIVLVWAFNKKFYSKIWDVASDVDDIEYASEESMPINFKEFQKFICVRSAKLKDIQAAINNCTETTPDVTFGDLNYKFSNKKIIVGIDQNCPFYNYHYLIQWLDTCLSTKNKEVYGLAINKSNPSQTYYVISDRTGKHINSLTGKTLKGDRFSINLLNDLEKFERLEINNKIKLGREPEIPFLLMEVNNLSFATTIP